MSDTVKIVTAAVSSIATQRVKRARDLLRQARSDEAVMEVQKAATVEEAFAMADHAHNVELLSEREGYAGEAEAEALYIKQFARRRIGQLTALLPKDKPGRKAKAKGGAEIGPAERTYSKGEVLAKLNLSKQRVSEYERMGRVPDGEFKERIDRAREEAEKKNDPSNVTRRTNSTKYDSDSCGTPSKYVESARKVLGGVIHCDPASNAFAQNTVRALRFYTKDDSSLEIPWDWPTIWLNQPYSRGLVSAFANKLCDEYAAHRFAAINLINSATDTDWYQRMVRTCSAICQPDHRISFEIMGAPAVGNLYSQTFFYLGNDVKAFAEEYRQYGAITVPYAFT